MIPLHYVRSQGHKKVAIILCYDGLQMHEHAVRLSAIQSFLRTKLQATNIWFFGSVGESVRPITESSLVQAQVGPLFALRRSHV
jgi:hypothetical protein